MIYSDAIAKPPKTLTDSEQRLLLKVSGEHRAGFRDHMIFHRLDLKKKRSNIGELESSFDHLNGFSTQQ